MCSYFCFILPAYILQPFIVFKWFWLENLCSTFVAASVNSDNEWFVSSCLWPCEPADLEGRIRVLIRLTEKTSHRDTLEVLCNLPGIKETNCEHNNLFVLSNITNSPFFIAVIAYLTSDNVG